MRKNDIKPHGSNRNGAALRNNSDYSNMANNAAPSKSNTEKARVKVFTQLLYLFSPYKPPS